MAAAPTGEAPVSLTPTPVIQRQSNLDRGLTTVLKSGGDIARLTPVDNAGLGLARAVSVVSVLRASPKLSNYKMIPLSGGQLINTDETLSLNPSSAGDVAQRRRIEIRLRKSAPHEASAVIATPRRRRRAVRLLSQCRRAPFLLRCLLLPGHRRCSAPSEIKIFPAMQLIDQFPRETHKVHRQQNGGPLTDTRDVPSGLSDRAIVQLVSLILGAKKDPSKTTQRARLQVCWGNRHGARTSPGVKGSFEADRECPVHVLQEC